MIRRNNLWIILALLLGLTNIYLVIQTFKLQKASAIEINNNDEVTFLNDNYHKLLKKELLECIDQNSILHNSITTLDEVGNLRSLTKLLPTNGNYKLVVRVSQANCFTCFTEAYDLIKKHTKALAISDVLYLGYYDDLTTMKTFMNSNFGKGVSQFNLQIPLNLNAEEMKQPYVFILDQNNTVHNVLIINKLDQRQIDSYLSSVIKRYF